MKWPLYLFVLSTWLLMAGGGYFALRNWFDGALPKRWADMSRIDWLAFAGVVQFLPVMFGLLFYLQVTTK